MLLPVKIGRFKNGAGLTWAARTVVTDVLEAWGAAQVNLIKQAFRVGGHQLHGGPAWPPDSDGAPILIDTGALQRSVNVNVTRNEADIVASRPYASFHHYGSGRLPARPITIITDQDIMAFSSAMITAWNGSINGAV